MERFAGVDTQIFASPQRGWRRVWDEVFGAYVELALNKWLDAFQLINP